MTQFCCTGCHTDWTLTFSQRYPQILPPALGKARDWRPGQQRAWSMNTMHDPKDGFGLGTFWTLCAMLWAAVELWTPPKGHTDQTQIFLAWPFLIQFSHSRGLQYTQQEWVPITMKNNRHHAQRAQSLSGLTYLCPGWEGWACRESGYFLFIQESSPPATVMPTVISVPIHS